MSAETVASPLNARSVIEASRWLVRAAALATVGLFATSMNPFGVIPEPGLLNQASWVALGAVPLALLFDVVFPPTKGRLWPALRLLVGLPIAGVAMIWIALASGLPGVVNRVTAPSGQQYMLGVGPMPTDVDYQLWESVGPGGIFWRPAEMLTWSEDGSFTEAPQLILVDDRWLMVRRGGIWTDCYEIRGKTLESCGGGRDVPDWQQPGQWRVASAAMALKVGVEPDEV